MRRRSEPLHWLLERFGLEFRRPGAVPGGRWMPYRLREPLLPASIEPSGMVGRSQIYYIPIERITASPGFSYARHGWHPYVQTLQEHLRDPTLRYEESTLCRLFTRFIPENAQHALLEDVEVPIAPLCWLPPRVAGHEWLLTKSELGRVQGGCPPRWMTRGKRLFGPVENREAKAEFEQLIQVYGSVKDLGLRLDLSTDPIRGYFLVRGQEYRFVLSGGQHRVAALSLLGEETVPVTIDSLGAIHEDQLLRWTEARGGPYSIDVAQQIFEKLFRETGRSKARNLGLLR